MGKTDRSVRRIATAANLGAIADQLAALKLRADEEGEEMLSYLIEMALFEARDQIKRTESRL